MFYPSLGCVVLHIGVWLQHQRVKRPPPRERCNYYIGVVAVMLSVNWVDYWCRYDLFCTKPCQLPWVNWLGDGDIYPMLPLIPFSGKLSREKPFTNFAVLWLFAKVSPMKFGAVVSFCMAKASNPRKFSARKSPIYENFLPQKFPTIQYILIPHEALHACSFNMLLPTIWIRPTNLTVYCMR